VWDVSVKNSRLISGLAWMAWGAAVIVLGAAADLSWLIACGSAGAVVGLWVLGRELVAIGTNPQHTYPPFAPPAVALRAWRKQARASTVRRMQLIIAVLGFLWFVIFAAVSVAQSEWRIALVYFVLLIAWVVWVWADTAGWVEAAGPR